MAGKYLNGRGLVHLWEKIKELFLTLPEEIENPEIINREFATFDDTNPHECGNSHQGGTNIYPLQVTPGFTGTTGCYVYETYTDSGTRKYRAAYQLNGSGQLYTVPSSGSPTLVTQLSNLGSGVITQNGFYVKQDAVYGNWWLTNSNTTIDKTALGIPVPSGGGGTDPEEPPVVPQETHAEIYIVNVSLDQTQLNDSELEFWEADTAVAWIKAKTTSEQYERFAFTVPITQAGGTRICYPVPDGYKVYKYTLPRVSAAHGYIQIERQNMNPDSGLD